jgi:hypothetical protein
VSFTEIAPAKRNFLIDHFSCAEDDFTVSSEVKVVKSFDEMGLREDLLKGVYNYGTNTKTQDTINFFHSFSSPKEHIT